MSSRCVFCGKTPTTLEHVFSPEWLKKEVFLPTDSFETRLTKRDVATGEELKRTWTELPSEKGKKFGPKVFCACTKCNSEWMERLDTKARPALTPLVLGEAGTVSSAGVELLATWATKIALVMDSGLGDEVIAESIKHAFREDPSPLSNARIWIGARTNTHDQVHVRSLTLVAAPRSTDVKAYLATFQVLHILFQVFIPIAPDTHRVGRRRAFAHFVHPFWPDGRGKQLRWPPPERTWLRSDEDFHKVAEESVGIPA